MSTFYDLVFKLLDYTILDTFNNGQYTRLDFIQQRVIASRSVFPIKLHVQDLYETKNKGLLAFHEFP